MSFFLQSKLVRVQEVAVWSNPTVSMIWVILSQMFLYYLCNWTTSLLSTLCYPYNSFKYSRNLKNYI